MRARSRPVQEVLGNLRCPNEQSGETLRKAPAALPTAVRSIDDDLATGLHAFLTQFLDRVGTLAWASPAPSWVPVAVMPVRPRPGDEPDDRGTKTATTSTRGAAVLAAATVPDARRQRATGGRASRSVRAGCRRTHRPGDARTTLGTKRTNSTARAAAPYRCSQLCPDARPPPARTQRRAWLRGHAVWQRPRRRSQGFTQRSATASVGNSRTAGACDADPRPRAHLPVQAVRRRPLAVVTRPPRRCCQNARDWARTRSP